MNPPLLSPSQRLLPNSTSAPAFPRLITCKSGSYRLRILSLLHLAADNPLVRLPDNLSDLSKYVLHANSDLTHLPLAQACLLTAL